MSKVEAICLNLPMHEESYVVGGRVEPSDKRIITEIRDNSIDAEQNFVHIMEIKVGNQVVKEFINTPMKIEYCEE